MDIKKVLKLFDIGKTLNEIAEIYNCSSDEVLEFGQAWGYEFEKLFSDLCIISTNK